MAHGVVVLFVLVVEIFTFSPVTGFTRLWVPGVSPPMPELPLVDAPPLAFSPDAVDAALLPLTGDGASSLDLRFSGRGGKNAIGDVDGVLEDVFVVVVPLGPVLESCEDDDDEVVVVFVVLVVVAVVVRPPRPLAPPFLSLLCT
jgi:hypothetical protein